MEGENVTNRIPKRPLLEVEWEDSATNLGWRDMDEHDPAPIVCKTVGYKIKGTKTSICLASSLSDQGGTNDRMIIPKGCIRAIRKVKME